MSAPASEQQRDSNPWMVLVVLCLGFFMILLDTTIVNVAIPSIIDGLHATLDEILWVLNAYVLVYAVLLITCGRLGDLYGQKRLFMLGLFVFTAASAACGLANTPDQLIAARIAQGVGGALLTPQTLSMITMIFPAERRGAAFGVWGAVAGVATIAGPTLGGLVVTRLGWEWIFYVNVPVGIVTIVLAAIVLPDLRTGRRHRLDLGGTALATAGLFFITYGLIEGQPHDWGKVWGPITIAEMIGGGVVLMIAFLIVQYFEKREPLVPFELFADRNFSLMNLVAAAIAFGMFGLFLPLTIYLQSVLGLSALQAGLTVAPMSVVSMFVAPVAGRMADRIGGKYILFSGLSLFAAGMGHVTWVSQVGAGRWDFLPGLLVAGLGMGLTFAPLQTVAMRNIQPRVAGAASGLINTTRQMGGVIGSAAVGALLQAKLAATLPDAARDNAQALPPDVRDRFVTGFEQAGSKGLEVGAGQTGAEVPKGLPAQVADTVARLAEKTFHEGYVHAMRPTFVLPIAVLGAGALSCLLIKRRRKDPEQPPAPAAEQPAVVA